MNGNGLLVIESDEEWYGGYSYTSGWLDTSTKWSQKYGKFEIRAQLPYGLGLWPAHWLMPETTDCWPTKGEM